MARNHARSIIAADTDRSSAKSMVVVLHMARNRARSIIAADMDRSSARSTAVAPMAKSHARSTAVAILTDRDPARDMVMEATRVVVVMKVTAAEEGRNMAVVEASTGAADGIVMMNAGEAEAGITARDVITDEGR